MKSQDRIERYKKEAADLIRNLREVIKELELKGKRDKRNLPKRDFTWGDVLKTPTGVYYLVCKFETHRYDLVCVSGFWSGSHYPSVSLSEDDKREIFSSLHRLSEYIKKETNLIYVTNKVYITVR